MEVNTVPIKIYTFNGKFKDSKCDVDEREVYHEVLKEDEAGLVVRTDTGLHYVKNENPKPLASKD